MRACIDSQRPLSGSTLVGRLAYKPDAKIDWKWRGEAMAGRRSPTPDFMHLGLAFSLYTVFCPGFGTRYVKSLVVQVSTSPSGIAHGQ